MKKIIFFFMLLLSTQIFCQENCNNGIDDDGDGKIDLNDPDCICNTSSITSIIPNHSFETFSTCPTTFSTPGDDQLARAVPWIQATTATSDFHNKCGYFLSAVVNTPLSTFPDGNGVAGALFLPDWMEYIGTKLLSPMVAGTNYQLTLNIGFMPVSNQGGTIIGITSSDFEPVDVTLYGCADGNNLPVATQFSPNSSDSTWFEIGHVTYVPNSNWGEITLTYTPSFDVNAIMIGSPQVLPPTYSSSLSGLPYFLYDNLRLNLSSAFGVNIAQTGNFCENNLVLTANLTASFSGNQTYQWYLNGVAIIGATSAVHNVVNFSSNLGQYSVKVTDGGTCYISSSLTINNILSSPGFTTIQPNCIIPTGTITITTPGSEYSFDNGLTWQTSPTKNLLAVGQYFIKIKTPSGCLSSATGVNIVSPQLLSNGGYTVVQPVDCNENGSITINSSIAAEYSFDDGVTWTTNSTASDLVPGTYYIKIKDAAGCQSSSQIAYINQVFMSSPEYTKVDPTCENFGSITITTVADEYSFDDGITWSTGNTATNLVAGTYYIKIRNSNGCVSYSRYVWLTEPTLNITPAYSIVQPSCGVGGSITITTTAGEYSFDGGTTWSTSNTATNLAGGYYVIKIRNNTFCSSYNGYVYLDNYYLPDPTYNVIQPTCVTPGEIEITSLYDEYSFDGGTTWTTDPNATNLGSGTYYVIVKSNLGCQSRIIYVNLNFTYLPDPDYTFINPACGNNGSITITTVANEYSFDGGTTWTTNPILSNLGEGYYFIMVRENPLCESNYLYVYLQDLSNTYTSYTIDNAGCNKYATLTITTVGDEYSFDGGTSWSSSNSITGISGPISYTVLVRIGSCTSIASSLTINSFFIALPVVTNYATDICDSLNDGSEVLNLSTYNSFLIGDPTVHSFGYYTSSTAASSQNGSGQISSNYDFNMQNTTLFVNIKDIYGCSSVAELSFSMLASPIINLEDDYILCENYTVTITETSNFDNYTWSTGSTGSSITLDEAGNYSLTAFENHGPLVCQSTENFTVTLSNPATIASFELSDWTTNENVIKVFLTSTSIGIYEYSLDGILYQDSNEFYNLKPGVYQVYIRDKNGCGIIDDEVVLLNYPAYFTPNADGFNDTWYIKFSELEESFETQIFDRYGKLLRILKKDESWDGNYNGRQLPSDDFWFHVIRKNGKVHKGHFAMKR